jgi:hypothetical protein
MGLRQGAKNISFCPLTSQPQTTAEPMTSYPVYSKSNTYILHIMLFMAMRLCIKIVPITMCAVYAIFTLIASDWTCWAIYGVLASLAIYTVLLFVNYALGFTLKCDNCRKPLTIGPRKKVGLKQEINKNVRKMNVPLVPVQWKEKAFRCVHCGSEFLLETGASR